MPTHRRFLFVTFDAGGNVTPTLALVRRLVRRGHEVRVLGNSALAERIIDSGGIFRAYARARDWDPPAPGIMAEERMAEMLAFISSLGLAEDIIAEAETADALVVNCMLPAARCLPGSEKESQRRRLSTSRISGMSRTRTLPRASKPHCCRSSPRRERNWDSGHSVPTLR